MSGLLQNLTKDQFSRISRLLDESIELPPDRRDAWLTDLAVRDPEAAAVTYLDCAALDL